MNEGMHDAVATSPVLPASYALCSFQGRPVLEIWTVQEVGRLWQHLHNGNGRFDWVMGFRDKATGAKQYKRSKQVPVERGLSWALATAQGRKTPEKSLAFVPYSTNNEQESRWGGFDFDAHGGELERARRFAFDAWRLLLNCESATILESTGSGGWHVWAVSRDFKPVAHWVRLLKGIARDIGASIESGVCEIFPPDTLSRGYGKGMRAPGSWNPGTNTPSEIYWQNADELIAELSPYVLGKFRRIGEVSLIHSDASPIEKKVSLSLLSLSELGRLIGGAEGFRISQVATRREKLKWLTGAAFNQVSRFVAEQMARAQFAEKAVATNADQAEHLRDLAEIWAWMESLWLESISDAEREKFTSLATDAERGAFRIIRSYSHKATQDGKADFPIARDNLGERVGITGEGAGLLRAKFVRLGIIARTAAYRANVAAARFRWLLATG
jgi:hypothetical protein